MTRVVINRFLDPAQCAAVCAALDRAARPARPEEELPHTMTGFDDGHAAEPHAGLDELCVLEEVRAQILDAVLDFDRGSERRLTTDFSVFKRAVSGHRKGPHRDTSGYPERVLTAVLYFNDCATGAIVFGDLREDPGGGFVERERLLPAAGRLVLFDDDPANAHAVAELDAGVRYSVMMFFRAWDGPGIDADWVARQLHHNPDRPLRVTATRVERTPSPDGGCLATLGDAESEVEVELSAAHAGWLDRILAGPPGFSITQLAGQEAGPSRLRLLELLALLARAGAIRGAG